jgi:hypothetical protein
MSLDLARRFFVQLVVVVGLCKRYTHFLESWRKNLHRRPPHVVFEHGYVADSVASCLFGVGKRVYNYAVIQSLVIKQINKQKLLGAAEARRAHNPEDARSKRAAATCH